MGHLPDLISDLALILITGAITTLIFKKIRQPLVLGYIIAGFLVGPHLSLTPTVADTENIRTWADIGVIFLLFSLGLEFSFKKLKRIGSEASVTGLFEIIFIGLVGFFTGKALGWRLMDSLFLGGMLASSSTTIILKAFDELGIKNKRFAQVVFGVLIVEDLVVILLMVLLSTVAVTQQFQGMEMLFVVFKLLFFLVLWFIAGIFLIPTLLKNAKKIFDEETLLVFSIGLCLVMVVLAVQVGFSAELGAFIMGSILAETTSAEKIEHLIKPVKNLFGAIFFVSVGMLIDPQAIVEYSTPVIVITLLMIFGKLFSSTVGALISGQPLKQSIQVGMSMAQVGEFAFIVAALGLSLGVTSDFLFPIAVGVSAISTFTTPYMIKYSPKFYDFVVRIIPEKYLLRIQNYSMSAQSIRVESKLKQVLKQYAIMVFPNAIIIVAILIFCFKWLFPFFDRFIENALLYDFVSLVVSVAIISPFLWAMVMKKPKSTAYSELWINSKYNHGPLLVLEIGRNIAGIAILLVLVMHIFSIGVALFIVIPLLVIFFLIFSQNIQKWYGKLENRFLNNYSERDKAEEANYNSIREQFCAHSELSLWNVHLVEIEVSPNADFLGQSLQNLEWRQLSGISIAYIKRGDRLIYAPTKDESIFPYDQLGVIGTDEQIDKFNKLLLAGKHCCDDESEIKSSDDIVIRHLVVQDSNQLSGKTILQSGIKGLIIGIERNGERIVNPKPETLFNQGDIVWLVGERD
ncbi:MAG: cation:proton antiporter [Prevotellaceae bacterium]|jgi:CPA2 family monovalent cation:H+ antiporter-2|nr:cation:proton antiporter [Prevotellaceae bacterium]